MTDQTKGEIIFAIIIGSLLLLFFVPPTWIAFKNTKFRTSLRFLFSFTVVPLFMVLMTINYFYIADHFPSLVDLFNSIPEGRKSGKSASMLAFLLTCPVAVLGCYLWYKLLEIINRKIVAKQDTIRSNEEGAPDQKAVR
jgi:hypothetical protein